MTRRSDATAIPSALERVDEIRARATGRRLAVFLDYDGTLTPIVDRPEDAWLAPAMRERVARLAARLPVAVVSGRDLADVRGRVGLEGITYAGSHGLDIDGPGGRRDAGPAAAAAVARATAVLRRRVGSVAGVVIEPKRFGVSVHYRLVDPAAVPALVDAVDQVVREAAGLRRRDGKMVLEVQPDVPWDKGRAVQSLVTLLGGRRAVHALYLGDDRTDEDAFRALRSGGTGIVVWSAPRPTAARYHLRDPDEVGALLDALGTA
jgi:trehalose 6-phosphate phosphatase